MINFLLFFIAHKENLIAQTCCYGIGNSIYIKRKTKNDREAMGLQFFREKTMAYMKILLVQQQFAGLNAGMFFKGSTKVRNRGVAQ